jgi:methylase of polypeptide subunit release factors
LAHCKDEEASALRELRIGMNVVSYILELAVKYRHEDQIVICRMELERLKKEFDDIVHDMFKRTGIYPNRKGKVEILQSGDVMEYTYSNNCSDNEEAN